MLSALRRAWTRLNDRTVGDERFWYIAVQNLSFYRDMAPLVRECAGGAILDVGAGRLSTRKLLASVGTSYTSCDVCQTHPELDVVCDITKPLPFGSSSFDTLYCCSVLEHTRAPWTVFDELFRILRPGGRVILSVPFIFYLHGAPEDYFRFTRHGVTMLAEKAGFQVERLVTHGGLFHTLLNVGSLLNSASLELLRLRFLIGPTTRAWTRAARVLDSLTDSHGAFANAIIVVLRRPEREHTP